MYGQIQYNAYSEGVSASTCTNRLRLEPRRLLPRMVINAKPVEQRLLLLLWCRHNQIFFYYHVKVTNIAIVLALYVLQKRKIRIG